MNAQPLSLLQNILRNYLDLPCFYIEGGRLKSWRALVSAREKRSAVDFEDPLQWEERIAHNERALNIVFRSKKPFYAQHRGLHAVLVPVLRQGRCQAVLHTGPFLRALPTQAGVQRQWKSLSGRQPHARDPRFLDYVRTLADTPVLDPKVLQGLRELFTLFAAMLSGAPQAEGAARRMDRLQVEVFARHLWHRQWVDWQVIQKRFFRFNGDPKTLMDWEREELGLRRFPSTVLAAKREGTGQEWTDWLAARAFQEEARRLAKGLEESIAYPLQNYGTLLLCSAKPGLDAAAEREAIERTAQRLREQLARRFQCKVWVGVGASSPTGHELQASYHQAIAALHVAVSKDRPVVFHADLPPAPQGSGSLRRSAAQVAKEAREGGGQRALRQRDTFVQGVVLETQGRPEAARRVFLEALHHLIEILEQRQSLGAQELADLESEINEQMETALNLHEMVLRFEVALATLCSFLDKALEGGKTLRLGRALDAIASAPERPWTLPQAAKHYGFSKTVFSREFARYAGMPFSRFLLTQRLEKAKRLLRESEQSLSAVSEACGFQSVNYFLQVFKTKVGRSPGAFRRQ